MLLTKYHPGHPSTENKFKIHMVNLSSVNHSKSWPKNIAWLFGIFTYIYILVTLFTGSQFQTWRRIHEQGANKIIFKACRLGKLKLSFTSPDAISASPKNFLTSRIYFTVLALCEFLKKHHLPVRQVNLTEFSSPIAKSKSPGLSNTTFFAH